jgi:uncharacterized protein YndB with AHSA1/START domain
MSIKDREITTVRVLKAPRASVFKAWVEPEYLAQWWGPKGFRNTFYTFELKPGGIWDFMMHAPDGSDYPNKSVFVEIVPYERIVFDHVSGHQFRVTASFEEQEESTRLVFHMLFESAEECIKVRSFVESANEENFDRLEEVIDKIKDK